MAELFEDGVVNTVDAAAESNITVDMLDYTYVNGCEDHKQLSAILNLLKSGKEGYYPDVSNIQRITMVIHLIFRPFSLSPTLSFHS